MTLHATHVLSLLSVIPTLHTYRVLPHCAARIAAFYVRSAVIENEFGEIGIDDGELESGGMQVVRDDVRDDAGCAGKWAVFLCRVP